MKINVIGFPYSCEYESECLDTIRLWSEIGLGIRIIPTAPLSKYVLTKLTDLGCDFAFHLLGDAPNKILETSNIRREIVIGLYDPAFFMVAANLRMMGCKLIWMGNPVVLDHEKTFYKDWGLCEYYIVKSFFHYSFLLKNLSDFRCDSNQILRIKPAFFCDNCEFNIVPHIPGTTMCIGKAGCIADQRFYPSNSWKILEQASVPISAIVTEWSDQLNNITNKPKWVDAMPIYKPSLLYSKIHCLVQVSNRKENWLRFALDAMAYGSPVIAQNDSSWKELIRHGENGFLCNSPEEVSELINILAQNENLRVEMAIRAKESLCGELIDNNAISLKWNEIFRKLV